MADLFISYSRQDTSFVRALSDALESAGRDVWVDWQDIPVSARWRAEIQSAIDAASVLIFVISPASVASVECRNEIDYAVAHGKRLIPVVIEKPDPAAVPDRIGEINWLFLRPDELAGGVKQLIATIDTDLDWSRAHAELLRRAKDWQAAERDNGKLLRGRDLAQAERWLATNNHAPKPVAVQNAFVAASRLAATSAQRRRVVLSGVAAVLAIGLSIWALRERQIAAERYEQALSRQLTIQSDMALAQPDQLNLSVQLATEAMRRVPSFEAQQALQAGLKLLPRLQWRSQAPSRTGVGLAFSPDGRFLLNADAAWHGTSGELVTRFKHEGRSTLFVVSEDGNLMARRSGRWDGKLWSREGGEAISLQAPEGGFSQGYPIETLAFSRDGRFMAGADVRGNVRVWRIADRALIQTLEAAEPTLSGPTVGLSFSPDGRTLATARRNMLDRWSTETWERVVPPTAAQGGIRALAYRSDGAVAIAAGNGEISVYESGEKPVKAWRLDSVLEYPVAIAFSAQGRYFGARSKGGTQIWDLGQNKSIINLAATGSAPGAFAFAPEGESVAIGGGANTINVFALPDGRELARMPHEAAVVAIAFSADGSTIASAGADAFIHVWDALPGYPAVALRGDRGGFTGAGNLLVAQADRQPLEAWDAAVGKFSRVPAKRSIRQAFLSANGMRAVGALEVDADDPAYDVLFVWSLPPGEEIARLAHEPPIDWEAVRHREVEERKRSLRPALSDIGLMRQQGSATVKAMSIDGRFVLSTRIDELARLWRVQPPTLIATIPYQRDILAAFSRDGARLAIASNDAIDVLDSVTGKRVAALALNGKPSTLLIDDVGQRVVALDEQGAALWDLAHSGDRKDWNGARAASISPNGRALILTSEKAAQWIELASGKAIAAVACACRDSSVVWSADSARAAIVGEGAAHLLPTSAGALKEITFEYGERGAGIAFSPDGGWLAMSGARIQTVETQDDPGRPRSTGSEVRWVRLWRLKDGVEGTLEQADRESSTPVFSPDSRQLAAGKVMWDVDSGRRVAAVDAPIIAFSPDGALVVSNDGTWVRAAPWRAKDLLALACKQLPASLSEDAWRRFVGPNEAYRKSCGSR